MELDVAEKKVYKAAKWKEERWKDGEDVNFLIDFWYVTCTYMHIFTPFYACMRTYFNSFARVFQVETCSIFSLLFMHVCVHILTHLHACFRWRPVPTKSFKDDGEIRNIVYKVCMSLYACVYVSVCMHMCMYVVIQGHSRMMGRSVTLFTRYVCFCMHACMYVSADVIGNNPKHTHIHTHTYTRTYPHISYTHNRASSQFPQRCSLLLARM